RSRVSLKAGQRLGIRREGNALAERGDSLRPAALLTGSHVPETHVVPAGGGKRFAVRGEGDGIEILLVPRHGVRDFAGRHVPKLDEISSGLIPTVGGKKAPVAREGHSADEMTFGLDSAALLARRGVPDVDNIGGAGRGEQVGGRHIS